MVLAATMLRVVAVVAEGLVVVVFEYSREDVGCAAGAGMVTDGDDDDDVSTCGTNGVP